MKTAALPNPAVAIEALAVFVVSTSVLATVVLFNSYVKDDWYLNHLNSIVSALLAVLIAHRLYLGVEQRGARIAWACALMTVAILTVSQWFEGYTEKLETAIGIEDLDDICLWFVMPVGLLVAARSERIGRLPLQILIGGFIAQTASTWLDVLDDWLTHAWGYDFDFIEVLVDFSEFVFLQLYLIGLTFFMASLYLKRWPAEGPAPAGFSSSLRKALPTELRFLWWRLGHPKASFADYYAARITARLARGEAHATLGIRQRARSATSLRGATGRELEQWQRGAGTFRFLASYGLSTTQRCVDYGCGSLRIGMHLMRFLEPGHYWGVDVTRRFYEDGLSTLEPALLSDKQPRLDVITGDALQRIRDWQPDIVFSVSVLMHVPPREVGLFLGKIVSLLTRDSKAVILFDRTERNIRVGPMSWAYSESFLCEELRRIDPRLEISFRYFEPLGHVGNQAVSRLGMAVSFPDPSDPASP